jgi:5-methylcytosine-specific restriction enzyme subunit McrC
MSIPVEIEYDEFTADTAENQLLRAAVERLLSLPSIPPPVRARLLHQRARLADVSVLIRCHRLPAWRPTRLNARYHHALHLADLGLRGASVEHFGGAVRIDGFLFDMNKVFEDFVTVALSEALTDSNAGGLAKLQAHYHLAKGNAPHAAHQIRNTGIRIHQHSLDLDQAPERLLAEVAAIAESLVADAHAQTGTK